MFRTLCATIREHRRLTGSNLELQSKNIILESDLTKCKTISESMQLEINRIDQVLLELKQELIEAPAKIQELEVHATAYLEGVEQTILSIKKDLQNVSRKRWDMENRLDELHAQYKKLPVVAYTRCWRRHRW